MVCILLETSLTAKPLIKLGNAFLFEESVLASGSTLTADHVLHLVNTHTLITTEWLPRELKGIARISHFEALPTRFSLQWHNIDISLCA